jgi:putative methyltransferase (TIGR04325 family)
MRLCKRLHQLIIGAKTYSSYESALDKTSGYNSELLAQVVVDKTRRLREKLLQIAPPLLDDGGFKTLLVVLAAAASSGSVFRVIDFGGAAGHHYFGARALIPKSKTLDWRVVETEAMVLAATEFESEELKFYTSISEAESAGPTIRVDLVLASSVIQYLPKPLEALDALIAISSTRIFLTRTPLLVGNSPEIIVQKSRLSENGPGAMSQEFKDVEVAYPATFETYSNVKSRIEKEYELEYIQVEVGGSFFAGKQKADLYTFSGVR